MENPDVELREVGSEELLSRCVTSGNEYLPSTGEVKPKLFIPYKYVELSVTRHNAPVAGIDL